MDVDDEAGRSLREIWRGFSDPRQATALAWLAFLVTWLITRAITIRGKDSGGAAITIAGHHVHHYIFGLVLLGLVGAVSVFWKPKHGWEWLGVGYGIGLALILDEYALLLNLKDVYWKHQGRLSVFVVVTVVAVGGIYLAAMTLVHEFVRKARQARGRSRHGDGA